MVMYNTRQQPVLLRGGLHLFYVSVITNPTKQGVISSLGSNPVSQLILNKSKPAHNREHG